MFFYQFFFNLTLLDTTNGIHERGTLVKIIYFVVTRLVISPYKHPTALIVGEMATIKIAVEIAINQSEPPTYQ